MKIVAFTRYGSAAASTRQRLLQYIPALEDAGITVDCHPLFDDSYVEAIARGQRRSSTGVISAYSRRLRDVRPSIEAADIVWVYGELFPYLPAFFENLAQATGKPVVYDFDDAFFLAYELHPSQIVRRLLSGRLNKALMRASACLCGNRYLQDYTSRFCRNTVYLPTVVNTDLYVPSERVASGPPVIGWIGTPSTWRYVQPILPALRRVTERTGARLKVVGAGHAAEADGFAQLESVDWTMASEVSDIQSMDIGIMPAIDEPWAHGKCGYKLIQYMGCGLPVVATPLGAANDIFEDGRQGFMALGTDQWEQSLERLIGESCLRAQMGLAGRGRVVERFSLSAHAPRLIETLAALSPARV